jgi:hypothetical protein
MTELITTLRGITTGKYKVKTRSGTTHIFDLDRKTVTRYGAEGHEWKEGTANAVAGADGEPFHYTFAENVEVGHRFYVESRGAYLDPDIWRYSTEIQSIEKINEGFENEI